MQPVIAGGLARFVKEGTDLAHEVCVERWALEVAEFLKTVGMPGEAARLASLDNENIFHAHALRMGYVRGLLAKAEADVLATPAVSEGDGSLRVAESRKVFLVHGHDNEAKEGTARFLQRIGLQPIILHEEPSSGRTVIEKFETYSKDVAFAVVLLTPDDWGGVAAAKSDIKPRARQNVIMELGFFFAMLGRKRVCALHKGDVEIPSDFHGVLYIEMDEPGAWKKKLAQELVKAELPIDFNGLLAG